MTLDDKMTISMLDSVEGFVKQIDIEMMSDLRGLPTFEAKVDRVNLMRCLAWITRSNVLRRCESLSPTARSAAVEQKIAHIREDVEREDSRRRHREPGGWWPDVSETLMSLGYSEGDEWDSLLSSDIEDSVLALEDRFTEFDTVYPVPELWLRGITPADMSDGYVSAMREEGYLPPFNEDCDVRCEWVAFFLEDGTGATDSAKWQRVFGVVPRFGR